MESGPKDPLQYTLKEEVADIAVDKALDQLNLSELLDNDREIFFSKKAEYE